MQISYINKPFAKYLLFNVLLDLITFTFRTRRVLQPAARVPVHRGREEGVGEGQRGGRQTKIALCTAKIFVPEKSAGLEGLCAGKFHNYQGVEALSTISFTYLFSCKI